MDRDVKPVAARPRQASRRASAASAVQAAADVDRVVDAYCSMLLDKGFDDPEYWWWPRAVWVDPNQIIVDGENGNLYRVGFSTDDMQEVTFAEPVEVLETFTDLEPAAKARVLVAASRDTGSRSPARIFASREDTPAAPKAGSEGGGQGGANNVGMNREQLLQALGLPAEATDADIDAKTAELAGDTGGEGGDGGENGNGATPEPTSPTGQPAGGEAGEGGSGGEGAGAGEGAPATGDGGTPAAAAGTINVPTEIWEQVQANAAAGAQVAEDAEEARRDNTIAAASGEGKIPPAQREAMVNLHARDKDSFYTLLTAAVDKGGLAPGLVPVSQRGGSPSPHASAALSGGTPQPGGQAGPAGAPIAAAEYVPPEKMRALFGEAYVPVEPNRNGTIVVGG